MAQARLIWASGTNGNLVREAFNNWLDSLHREGRIDDYQAFSITLGKH